MGPTAGRNSTNKRLAMKGGKGAPSLDPLHPSPLLAEPETREGVRQRERGGGGGCRGEVGGGGGCLAAPAP